MFVYKLVDSMVDSYIGRQQCSIVIGDEYDDHGTRATAPFTHVATNTMPCHARLDRKVFGMAISIIMPGPVKAKSNILFSVRSVILLEAANWVPFFRVGGHPM